MRSRENRRIEDLHGFRRRADPRAADRRPGQHPCAGRAAGPVARRGLGAPERDAGRRHGASRRRRRPGVPGAARSRARVHPHPRRRRARRAAPARPQRDGAGVGRRRGPRPRHRGAARIDAGASRPAGRDPRPSRGRRHQHTHLHRRGQGVLRLGVPRRRHHRRHRHRAHRAAAARRTHELSRARRGGAPLALRRDDPGAAARHRRRHQDQRRRGPRPRAPAALDGRRPQSRRGGRSCDRGPAHLARRGLRRAHARTLRRGHDARRALRRRAVREPRAHPGDPRRGATSRPGSTSRCSRRTTRARCVPREAASRSRSDPRAPDQPISLRRARRSARPPRRRAGSPPSRRRGCRTSPGPSRVRARR